MTTASKVVRIAGEFDGSQVRYSALLDTQPNIIFQIGVDRSAELALAQEGDETEISYPEAESGSHQGVWL